MATTEPPPQVLSMAVALERGERILIYLAGGASDGLAVAVAAEIGLVGDRHGHAVGAEQVHGYGARVVREYHSPDWPGKYRLTDGGVAWR